MKTFIGKPIQAGQSKVYINPGTGPVENASLKNARKNMEAFAKELALEGIKIRRHKGRDEDDGRFGFSLKYGKEKCYIDMPGLPLEQVRWTKALNPWHFPRLYVDGSSWLWEFAVGVAKRHLTNEEKDE